MESKKIAEIKRIPERVSDEIFCTVRIEVRLFNGYGGKLIDSYGAVNEASIPVSKVKFLAKGTIADFCADILIKLIDGFRKAHGKQIISRSETLFDEIRSGLISVVAPPEEENRIIVAR